MDRAFLEGFPGVISADPALAGPIRPVSVSLGSVFAQDLILD